MAKQAGVLVIIEQTQQSLILTLRSKQLSMHAGEISFPGGTSQQDDKSTLQTAIRETEEEIGIEEARLSILQPMDKVQTLTGFEIFPYLATTETCEGYQLQPTEVDELILVPLQAVRQAENFYPFRKSFTNVTVQSIAFQYQDYVIWGATAKIMRQLVDLK